MSEIRPAAGGPGLDDIHAADGGPAQWSATKPDADPPTHHARLMRWLAIPLAMLLLALVFLAYLRPEFALDLANRFILCL